MTTVQAHLLAPALQHLQVRLPRKLPLLAAGRAAGPWALVRQQPSLHHTRSRDCTRAGHRRLAMDPPQVPACMHGLSMHSLHLCCTAEHLAAQRNVSHEVAGPWRDTSKCIMLPVCHPDVGPASALHCTACRNSWACVHGMLQQCASESEIHLQKLNAAGT